MHEGARPSAPKRLWCERSVYAARRDNGYCSAATVFTVVSVLLLLLVILSSLVVLSYPTPYTYHASLGQYAVKPNKG